MVVELDLGDSISTDYLKQNCKYLIVILNEDTYVVLYFEFVPVYLT